MISEHLTTFHGKPVANWRQETGFADPSGTAYRVGFLDHDFNLVDEDDDDEPIKPYLRKVLDDPHTDRLEALVIGCWPEPNELDASEVLEGLVEERERLPALEAVFVGDIIYSQCEISWIQQCDLSPLLRAFPGLQRLGARGGECLSLGRRTLDHAGLRALTLQTGGMDRSVIKQLCQAKLPGLVELELWLGAPSHGGSVQLDDLVPIMSGKLFPKLRRLAIRNALFQDAIAWAVASSPLLERLEELDLSMGTLGNGGAEALLASPALKGLKRLNVNHHYIGWSVVERLRKVVPEVLAEDARNPDEDRYVEVAE